MRLAQGPLSTWWAAAPLSKKGAAVGAILLGVVGGIAGLVIGLNPPNSTTTFAVIELGFPGAVVGAVLGLLVGLVLEAQRRVRHRNSN